MDAGLWYVAVFSLATGVMIPAFWAMLLLTGRIGELREGRRDIWLHIAAEIATGALLVAGAAALIADGQSRVSFALSGAGLGALVYTLIQSPGYYVDRRDWPMVGLFAVTWIACLPAIALLLASAA
jgi:hypothetical protein